MPLREVEPGIDVPEHPCAETGPGNSVLTPSLHWKAQGSTLLPSAQKRNFRRVWGWGPEEVSVTPTRFEMCNPITRQRDTLARIRQIAI
jgi:hypothetical protein